MVQPDFTKPNPAFEEWKATMPATHWAKYDLSACRLGWEAAMALTTRKFDEWRATALRCEAIFPLISRMAARAIEARPDLKDEIMARIEAMEKLFERASFAKLREIHARFEHLDGVFLLAEDVDNPFQAAACSLWIAIDDLMNDGVVPPPALSEEG
jgi:hypothetical protein